MKEITLAISTAFQDGGDATRAIEIAKALKKYRPNDMTLRIIFISHGSRFEQTVMDLGFEIYRAEPKLQGIGLYHDLGMTATNLVSSEELASEMIRGEIAAYGEIKPDMVMHGFWPIASLARRMMKKEIPGICFAPLPLVPNFFKTISDVPEQLRMFSIFPKPLRIWLFRRIPDFIKNRVPILRQNNIRRAAYDLGWKGKKLVNVFDLLEADLMIVNDLSDYYDRNKFPANVKFTGSLFSIPDDNASIGPEIMEVFDPKIKKPKIFCSFSSSGSEEMLKEVIEVFAFGPGQDWNAVILSPHFPVEKARKLLGERRGVHITDKFVPALKINAMADVTISHGGQGTLQTSLYSGVPIVGVAAQQEQFINLSNMESRGAGIRIPRAWWNAKNIQRSVLRILSDARYRESAMLLRKCIRSSDGAKNAAVAIWETMRYLAGLPRPAGSQ
ncbi:MAG: hypothetical protein LBF54_01260 [Holosporaceae bacterium]|jgi:UDP:flavonoid glycosyltransferase YjiC (YdhE family)|nr:hypothetical protein [Holosporaceae bacterium]